MTRLRLGVKMVLMLAASLALLAAPTAARVEAIQRPVVTGVSPSAGPTTGGTIVTITGTGFAGATGVRFGSRPATAFTVHGDTWITATAPRGSRTVNVRVTTPGRTSRTGPNTRFRYVATPPPRALVDADYWTGVSIAPPASGTGNADQYLRGGPFDAGVWSTQAQWRWWALFIAGNGNPQDVTTYGGISFKNSTWINGSPTRALSLAITADAPATTVEQIRITDYQEPGRSGVGGRSEPVFYQRMYLKFDENTLARAARVGAADFYQIFWEQKSEPDFRLRVQLRYDGSRLYWQAQSDALTNADPIHDGSLMAPVVIAPAASPRGWHKFETWINRETGTWRAAVDGRDIINLTGADLMGPSGNIMNFPMFMQLYGDSAMGPGFAADAPMEIRIAQFELWDRPPSNAWTSWTP